VIGVGLVMTIAVGFFRKDNLAGAQTQPTDTTTAAIAAPPAEADSHPVSATTTARHVGRPGRRYTVREGDTLPSLAQRYYGDEDKADALYRANRDVLKSEDDLPAGTELVIPDLTKDATSKPEVETDSP
jgi:nucleoid-associated protein YgaU